MGGRDRAGQPPAGPPGRATAGQDGLVRRRPKVLGSSAHHRLLHGLQVRPFPNFVYLFYLLSLYFGHGSGFDDAQ